MTLLPGDRGELSAVELVRPDYNTALNFMQKIAFLTHVRQAIRFLLRCVHVKLGLLLNGFSADFDGTCDNLAAGFLTTGKNILWRINTVGKIIPVA